MKAKKLVVIIPALNEQRTVSSVVQGIPRQIPGIHSIETIVVDDGSTDRTQWAAQEAGARVVHHLQTRGVGAAFHTGMREALHAGADIIVNIDADGQFNPADIPTLIRPILAGRVGFVTCTRFAQGSLTPDMPPVKRWGNRWMVWIINVITGKRFTDVSCGFRAYTRDTALQLTLFGHFTYTQETLIDLAYKGVPMVEVPLRVRGVREHGRSRVADNVWRYGLKAATIIFRTARDYKPLIFFGVPGLVIFLLGVAGAVFLFIHWLQTGQTYPYRSLVQLSGVLVIVGLMLGFIAMLADMMHRNRMLMERMLFIARKQEYGDYQRGQALIAKNVEETPQPATIRVDRHK